MSNTGYAWSTARRRTCSWRSMGRASASASRCARTPPLLHARMSCSGEGRKGCPSTQPGGAASSQAVPIAATFPGCRFRPTPQPPNRPSRRVLRCSVAASKTCRNLMMPDGAAGEFGPSGFIKHGTVAMSFKERACRVQCPPALDRLQRTRYCRHSLKRHKERRRQKAEEQQCAQKKKRCTAGAAREKPADAPEPTSAKGGPPTSAAAKSGLKRCRPAGAAAATQPAPAAHSKPKRQQVEAAGHVSNATSAQAGRPVAAWPALSASSTPGQASPRWPEVPYCAVLQPSSDGSSTPFPSPVPLQHPLPLLPAMPAAQQLQPQADPQHAILHGMPAQGCVPMLAAEERAEPLAPGGCLQPPVSPERARAPLSELVEEALCILQAPEVGGGGGIAAACNHRPGCACTSRGAATARSTGLSRHACLPALVLRPWGKPACARAATHECAVSCCPHCAGPEL